MQGWLNMWKSVLTNQLIQHINKLKKKILQSQKKKIRQKQNRNRGSFFELIKIIHEKPTANIMYNGKRLNVFPWRSGTSNHLLFNPIPEDIASAMRQDKEIIIRHKEQKERSKTVFISKWHGSLRIKSNGSYKKPTRIHLAGGRIQGQYPKISCIHIYTNNKQ